MGSSASLTLMVCIEMGGWVEEVEVWATMEMVNVLGKRVFVLQGDMVVEIGSAGVIGAFPTLTRSWIKLVKLVSCVFAFVFLLCKLKLS